MAEKIERTYKTTFTGEALTMDKYEQLLKDIARLIADTDRENIILKYDLENTKAQLEAAESKIKCKDADLTAAYDKIETLVAKQAIQMMQEDDASA